MTLPRLQRGGNTADEATRTHSPAEGERVGVWARKEGELRREGGKYESVVPNPMALREVELQLRSGKFSQAKKKVDPRFRSLPQAHTRRPRLCFEALATAYPFVCSRIVLEFRILVKFWALLKSASDYVQLRCHRSKTHRSCSRKSAPLTFVITTSRRDRFKLRVTMVKWLRSANKGKSK